MGKNDDKNQADRDVGGRSLLEAQLKALGLEGEAAAGTGEARRERERIDQMPLKALDFSKIAAAATETNSRHAATGDNVRPFRSGKDNRLWLRMSMAGGVIAAAVTLSIMLPRQNPEAGNVGDHLTIKGAPAVWFSINEASQRRSFGEPIDAK